MKVLVISHKLCWKSEKSPTGWATHGGFAIQLMALCSIFDELELIAFETEKREEGEVYFHSDDIVFSMLPLKSYRGFVRKIWILSLALSKFSFFAKKIREADLIHTPIPSDLATIGMIIVRLMRKPLFIRHCGNWKEPKTLAEHLWKWIMIKRAGKNTLCLATGAEEFPPSHENLNIKWIFSTSLSEREINSSKRTKRKIDRDRIRLVTVTRQTYHKGTWRTIQALRILIDNGYKAELKIVGDGNYLDELVRITSQLNLEEVVAFEGQATHEEVMQILGDSDLFVMPTTVSEGYPKSIVEALSVGLPVISSSVSSIPFILNNPQCGISLDDLSAQSIAKCIEGLIQDQEKYDELSANGLFKAQQFTLEKWRDYIAEEINNQFGWDIAADGSINH